MSFHIPASAPGGSQVPSMANRRIPPTSIPAPGPYSQSVADYCVLPSPRNLPPISHLNRPLQSHGHSSTTNPTHGYPSAPQMGSNVHHVQAPPHPHHALASDPAASFRGGAGSSTSNAFPPPMTIDPVPPIDGQPWYQIHLYEIGVFARIDLGEDLGKIYFDLWTSIREAGSQDKGVVRLSIAKSLIKYPWFKGDKSIDEALQVLQRLDFVNYGLMGKKHFEYADLFWDLRLADVTVREYWTKQGEIARQIAQAQLFALTHAQPQALAQAHAQAQAQAQAEAQAQAQALAWAQAQAQARIRAQAQAQAQLDDDDDECDDDEE